MKMTTIALLVCAFLVGCASPRVHLDQIEDRVGPDGHCLAHRKGDPQPFTGKAFALHPNGRMKEERPYRAGRETGMYRTWYPNGQKQEEVHMVDGVANGQWHEWHANGQWEIRGTATNGCAIGRFRSWNPDGTLAENKVYEEPEKQNKMPGHIP